MSLYKYETHMHTSQGSDCSSTSGAKMVERLHALGYAGCFITDHFFGGNTAVNRDLAKLGWETRVRLFCQGYDDAKRRGDELGFQVFFGLEDGISDLRDRYAISDRSPRDRQNADRPLCGSCP